MPSGKGGEGDRGQEIFEGFFEEGTQAMPDRNNTNQVQRRRFPPEPRHSPC